MKVNKVGISECLANNEFNESQLACAYAVNASKKRHQFSRNAET